MFVCSFSMRITSGYNNLNHLDKVSLWLVLFVTMVGTAGNYVRLRTDSLNVLVLTTYLVVACWVLIITAITRGVACYGRSLREYGFTFRAGGLASLAVAVGVTSFKLFTSESTPQHGTVEFGLMITGAAIEEIVFRVLAIGLFLKLLDDHPRKVFVAILGSSILFLIPHLVTKSVSALIGLFMTSVIAGLVYYKSKSIILPMWSHVISNTSWLGGAIVIVAYVIITAFDLTVLPRIRRPSPTGLSETSEIGRQ